MTNPMNQPTPECENCIWYKSADDRCTLLPHQTWIYTPSGTHCTCVTPKKEAK